MGLEFGGIERRLDELWDRLARLRVLSERPREEFDADPFLRDVAERNLEVAIQCCIDMAHRIISIAEARRPRDYYEALLSMGELGVLKPEAARRLAPAAGFRNALAHEYLGIDWDEVHRALGDLSLLEQFGEGVRAWLTARVEGSA